MVFQWFFYGFSMVFLWFFNGFSMVFLWSFYVSEDFYGGCSIFCGMFLRTCSRISDDLVGCSGMFHDLFYRMLLGLSRILMFFS